MALVEMQDIQKAYQGNVVLEGIDLEIHEGEIAGLIGTNGSGKSVLMQIIAGLVRPDKGRCIVAGKVVGKDIEYPSDIGILINGPSFIPYFSAVQNLRLLAAYKNNLSRSEIDDVIKRVGLDPKEKKTVGKYSTGMKARLGIAQAIMENPCLLLLDEPFNGLDPVGVQDMYSVLRSLKDAGKTIILTSHIKDDIEALCDSVYQMESGKVISVTGSI